MKLLFVRSEQLSCQMDYFMVAFGRLLLDFIRATFIIALPRDWRFCFFFSRELKTIHNGCDKGQKSSVRHNLAPFAMCLQHNFSLSSLVEQADDLGRWQRSHHKLRKN